MAAAFSVERAPEPAPAPAVGGGRWGFAMGAGPADPLRAAAAAAQRVEGRFAIVRRVSELGPHPFAPVHAVVARGPRRLPGWRLQEPLTGTGTSTDPAAARLAAVAEVVERYAATAPAPEALFIRAASQDLAGIAVPPASFALLSSTQALITPGLDPLTGSRRIDWCPATCLTTGAPSLLPASLVHLARSRRPPNDYVAEVTTTGTACHVSLPHAVLGGLCEVLERDALTIWWHNRLPTRPLDVDDPDLAALVDGLGAGGFTFGVHELPSDSPFPVVLAAASRHDAPPHAAVGVACAPHAVAAARRAILEACQVLIRLLSVDTGPPEPDQVRTLDDHAAFYAGRDGAAHLRSRLGDGADRRSLSLTSPVEAGSDVRRLLDHAVRHLAGCGLQVHVVELTTADIAAAGWRVVRVIVPEALDMAADVRCQRFGGRRLYDLPVRLGLRRAELAEADLDRLPTPLA